jgi:hypothetical protein
MLARDDEFAIVVARADDTAESLAQDYLGDARKAWWQATAPRSGRARSS